MDEVGQWNELYGDFQFNRDFHDLDITNLNKESGWIRGEIVHAIQQLPIPKGNVLLPGEYIDLKSVYADLIKVDEEQIITAGLGDRVDYQWNFEHKPTFRGHFSLIISQAMLEHLIDPYRHVHDLFSFLGRGGHLILHTVIPGFPYHRYPIDCMRFYPDWFEEVAKRLSARVVWKHIGEQRILYIFKKEKSTKRRWWKF